MSRARIARSAAAALVALSFLIVVASAGAAAWQGPVPISVPNVNAGDTNHSPLISMGVSGDAAAGWWDPSGIMLARKLKSQTWSAPITLGPTATASVYSGVDAAGNVTAAWTTAAPVTMVSFWPANAASATSTPLVGALTVNDLAVSPSGTAVLAATSGSNVVVGYRPAGGSFTLHTIIPLAGAYVKPRVAINAAGMAVVIFRDNANGLWASTRTLGTDWDLVETIRSAGVVDQVAANPSVAIDSAGNVFAAYAYMPPTAVATVRTSLRFPTGVWQESGDLSSAAASFDASFVTVAVNPSGTAILAWKQIATGFANVQARYGSTGTGIWGGLETVNDAGADAPVAAIADNGRAVVAWEREIAASNNIGQARVREPGAAGAFGDIHNLSLSHANVTAPSIAGDGRGDFAVISAPFDGTAQRAIVSAYDAAPPTLSAVAVSGTLLAGEPVSLTTTATDEWSAVGVPAWTFGDGGTGTGASVQHAYAAAGAYTAHVTVTDGSGNSSGRDIAITVGSPQAVLTSAKFAGKWKVSRVKGTLTVVGTAPRAGSYAIDVLKGKTRKIHVAYTLPVGAFTKTITLPVKFVPGPYFISLIPADAQVKGANRAASLAAPASGVVDVGFLSGARNGTAARTLTGATTIWASFHFAAKPKGKLLLTWYRLGKKRVRLGATTKDSTVKVVSYLSSAKPFVGTYQAVLSRKGVVIARVSVKAKG
jgi:hypothetical protein